MLMAAGMECPRHVFAHGFLMAADGSKMSKSKGNALYPRDLIEHYGVDAYRYYFLSDVTFGSDANIGHDRITQVYNADLANTYGNLFSRVSNMVIKYFDGQVPEVPRRVRPVENPLSEIVEGLYERYAACMNDIDFGGASAHVMELLHRANLYVEESAPWNLAKNEETQGELAFVLLQRTGDLPHRRAAPRPLHAQYVDGAVESPGLGRPVRCQQRCRACAVGRASRRQRGHQG